MSTNYNAPQNGYITVEDVLRFEYSIPKYQRGYRWEKEHVSKLLQDVYENKLICGKTDTNWAYAVCNKNIEIFNMCNNAIESAKQPYCIQPLVVCENAGKYDVIDGQQRLTTISIIICALKTVYEELYLGSYSLDIPEIKLSYESRFGREYLNNLWEGNVEKDDSKLDYRYMYQAYEVAKEFFYKELRQEKCEVRFYAELLMNILLKNTRFIWYRIDKNGIDPHEVFANFNTGKLELTNAELIKALFMDASNYDNVKDVKDIEDKRIVISEKWDEIETSLHNPDFWAFVPHPHQYEEAKYDTRIDVIFELFLLMYYIDKKGKSLEDYIKYRREEKKDRYIFDEIEEWIKKELEARPNKKNSVMQNCWNTIRKVYLGLQELYQIDTIGNNTNKIYNMVGLYINLANRTPGRVDDYVKDDETFLRVYYNLAQVLKAPRFKSTGKAGYRENRKSKLQELIKREIGFDYDDTVERAIIKLRHNYSNETNVNKESDIIVKTLLAYNVGLLNNSDGIGQRFDFKAFANLKWEREHIFASNVDEAKNKKDGLDSEEERKAALKVLSEELELVQKNKKESGENILEYKNKYVEYVKKVYFYDREFPPKFVSDEKEVVLDINVEEQREEFIDKYYSENREAPNAMLAKALRAYVESKKCEFYYYILNQIKEAKKYQMCDKVTERKIYYLILQNLKDSFYKKEYVDITKDVNEVLEDYPQQPLYIIKIGTWEKKITTDADREKSDVVKNLCDSYLEYVRDLYMKDLVGDRRVGSYEIKEETDIDDQKWEEIKLVFEKCQATLEIHLDDFFEKKFAKLLKDNTMGNMTLLTGGNKKSGENVENQNQKAGNKTFKLKKKMIREAFQKGEFVPLGTVLVFSDAYNDSANTANFWLPDSRLRYLDNMIKTLTTFLNK